MPWSVLSSGVSALGGLVGSLISNKSTNAAIDKQIAAQREANQQNIALQREINNKNLAYQTNINNIMRSDANNAIGIKKRDLINSGYSTADPTFSGHTTASLSSPALSAAQVSPEYSGDMAALSMQSDQNVIQSMLQGSSLITDTLLKKAQSDSLRAGTRGQEITNSWLDAQQQVIYDTALQNLSNLVETNNLTKKQQDQITKNLDFVDGQLRLLNVQIERAVMDNEFRPYEFMANIEHLSSMINQLNSVTDLNRVEKDIKGFEKRVKSVEAKFAEMGINFNGTSIFDTILRAAASPDGSSVVPILVDFIFDSTMGLFDRVVERFGYKEDEDPNASGHTNPFNRPAPGSRIGKMLKNFYMKYGVSTYRDPATTWD